MLQAYGFGRNSLRPFFDNRQNRVKLNDTTSDWKEMVRGCPQGSSIGPLLWNMFQNDLSYHVKDLSMYADDHQLYGTGNNYELVESSLIEKGD